jgi:hypothetical protein
VTLTNRGEESVAKNWELCMVLDGKPFRFKPGPIPDDGIQLSPSEKILKAESLTEKVIREPIAHARSVTGWVSFSVPKEQAIETISKNKFPDGSIQYQDYLAHRYSWDFTGKPETDKPKSLNYVPGHN